MVSNTSVYVLDCGLGVTNQFARTGVPFTIVRSIFITHHHPDHNIEYGPFLLIGWVQGLPRSVRAFGPPPLRQMTEDFLCAYRTTIDFWAEDFQKRPMMLPDVKEVSTPGTILHDENVRVAAAIVHHPPVRPALAYRFVYRQCPYIKVDVKFAASSLEKSFRQTRSLKFRVLISLGRYSIEDQPALNPYMTN